MHRYTGVILRGWLLPPSGWWDNTLSILMRTCQGCDLQVHDLVGGWGGGGKLPDFNTRCEISESLHTVQWTLASLTTCMSWLPVESDYPFESTCTSWLPVRAYLYGSACTSWLPVRADYQYELTICTSWLPVRVGLPVRVYLYELTTCTSLLVRVCLYELTICTSWLPVRADYLYELTICTSWLSARVWLPVRADYLYESDYLHESDYSYESDYV